MESPVIEVLTNLCQCVITEIFGCAVLITDNCCYVYTISLIVILNTCEAINSLIEHSHYVQEILLTSAIYTFTRVKLKCTTNNHKTIICKSIKLINMLTKPSYCMLSSYTT